MEVSKKKRNRPDLQNFGQENVNKGDNTRYLRHALTTMNLPPINIEDPVQVKERIAWYFKHCAEDDMKPTVAGLCNAIGIDRTTFYRWGTGESRGEGSEHRNLVKKARNILEELWEDYMLNGKINPVSGIFIGKNHFGYQDRVDVVATPAKTASDYDPDEIRRMYLGDGSIVDALPPEE